MRKLLAVLGIGVVALAATIGSKTWWLTPSRQLIAAPLTPAAVDAATAASRLGRASHRSTSGCCRAIRATASSSTSRKQRRAHLDRQ